MKKVRFMIGAAAMLLLASCKSSPKTTERVYNVFGEMQDSVETILQHRLPEYNAVDGVAIVMETKSGRIRAMVGLESRGDSCYVRADGRFLRLLPCEGPCIYGFRLGTSQRAASLWCRYGWSDFQGDSRALVQVGSCSDLS